MGLEEKTFSNGGPIPIWTNDGDFRFSLSNKFRNTGKYLIATILLAVNQLTLELKGQGKVIANGSKVSLYTSDGLQGSGVQYSTRLFVILTPLLPFWGWISASSGTVSWWMVQWYQLPKLVIK